MKTLKQMALLVMVLGASFGSTMAHTKTPSVVGVWDLDYSSNTMPDGEIVPYCTGAHGMIIYTKEGVMSVALNCDKRGNGHEPADSTGRRFFYAGNYEFNGVDVVHHLLNASEADLVGTSFTRHVEIDGDRLSLAGEIGGQSFIAVWKRRR